MSCQQCFAWYLLNLVHPANKSNPINFKRTNNQTQTIRSKHLFNIDIEANIHNSKSTLNLNKQNLSSLVTGSQQRDHFQTSRAPKHSDTKKEKKKKHSYYPTNDIITESRP